MAGKALCSNTEEAVDELTLAEDIALAQPANLSFPDCVHRFIALYGSGRAFGRPESETGDDALLNESMVLLDDVVQVRRSSTTTASVQFSRPREFGDGTGVRRMAIHIDDAR